MEQHKHCLHSFSKGPNDGPDVVDGDDACVSFEVQRAMESPLYLPYGTPTVREENYASLASCCKCRDVLLVTGGLEEKSHGGVFPKLRIWKGGA